jgi:2-dehydro-3-deoxyphosphogluconate aldolase/(4S)-4-hydroxy-2-oxoglutarate aldolase
MNKDEVIARIQRGKLLPVIRAPSSGLAFEAAQALVDGELDVLEITMTVPGAIDVIAKLVNLFGSKVLVGVGTVMDPATAGACIEAGARFIVSPSFDLSTVQACKALGVAVIPGALTPTEIVNAWRAGADVVKVFPCAAMGGPSYIRYLKAPLPDIPLLPTGGPNLENLGEYLAAGAIAVGVAGDLVDVSLLDKGRRKDLVGRAQDYVTAIHRLGLAPAAKA